PTRAPVAAFTATATDLTVEVDASDSAGVDGAITSYEWAFGDGATATGVTAAHEYTDAGDYTVTLTVTDEHDMTSTTTQDVSATEPANILPTAAFTVDRDQRTVSVDASDSTDTDGTITSYAWDFGDGTTAKGAT